MRSLIFTFLLTLVGLTCYCQEQVKQNFKYNIDKIFVDTIGSGENAYFIKPEYTSRNYDILIHDTLSSVSEDKNPSKIEILGSQNLDSTIYYYFVEKIDHNLVLSAIAFHKYKKGGYEVSGIYTFSEKLLTYYFDEIFYLFFYNEEVNVLDIVAINGEKIIYEKSIVNKMPFFAGHIDKANPIIPINNKMPISTFESSFKNKLFKEENTLIFTFDMYAEGYNVPFRYGNSTEILEVDLSNDLSKYTIVRAPEVEEILAYNSFYLDSKLYRISVSYNYINIAAFDFASKSLINQYSIYRSDTLCKLASSPYYIRVGSAHTLSTRGFKKTKQLIFVNYLGAPSISAYNIDKHSVQLTIGNYYNERNISIALGGVSILADIMTSAFLTVLANLDTGYSNYFYSHYSRDGFTFLKEKINTLSQKVDNIEVGVVKNKNKMRGRTYFSSSNKVKFIYQDQDSKHLHIIE